MSLRCGHGSPDIPGSPGSPGICPGERGPSQASPGICPGACFLKSVSCSPKSVSCKSVAADSQQLHSTATLQGLPDSQSVLLWEPRVQDFLEPDHCTTEALAELHRAEVGRLHQSIGVVRQPQKARRPWSGLYSTTVRRMRPPPKSHRQSETAGEAATRCAFGLQGSLRDSKLLRDRRSHFATAASSCTPVVCSRLLVCTLPATRFCLQ